MRTAPISQSDALPGRSPVVSTSTTTYRAASTGRSTCPARARASLSPRQARRVTADDVVEKVAREPGWYGRERKERARRLLRRHRRAPLLDQLDEPVGRVERELHPVQVGEHTFGYKGSRQEATPPPERPAIW